MFLCRIKNRVLTHFSKVSNRAESLENVKSDILLNRMLI